MITVATMIIIYHDCHRYNDRNVNEDSKTMVETAINICMMITIYDTDSSNNNNDTAAITMTMMMTMIINSITVIAAIQSFTPT